MIAGLVLALAPDSIVFGDLRDMTARLEGLVATAEANGDSERVGDEM